jgi:formate-dependent nitrite reductase membrane component NrfD
MEPTPTYYGLPVVKPPVWTWEVPTYFFLGGAAGASAVVASVSELARVDGDGALARDAKWIAAVGGIMSAGLLTSDLGRPERFLNMLRVFKLQSPMSVGAWTLTAFSSAAAASAFADLVRARTNGRIPVALVGDAAGMLAAATGLVMTTYTGVLIGATVIPAWNRHARILPIHFAASGLGSAVSMLELLGHDEPALNTLAIIAALVGTATSGLVQRDRDEASWPLKHTPSGWVTRLGGLMSGPLPLILRIAPGKVPHARRAAAAISLAGALLTRFGWWAAGSESARDARLLLRE